MSISHWLINRGHAEDAYRAPTCILQTGEKFLLAMHVS